MTGAQNSVGARGLPWWTGPVAAWAMFSLFALAASWMLGGGLQDAAPRGPDDLLRMVEVRDWLAGQAWTDVGQHRLAPPDGAPMHWSRLVDLPIAAVVLLLETPLGRANAEGVALVAVPLLTALGVILAGAIIVRRLFTEPALLFPASLFLAATPMVALQVTPMRIDHHGWQIVCGLAAIAAALGHSQLRSGGLAGLFMALWLSIGIEGLPMAAALGGVLGMRTLRDEAESRRLIAYLAALAGASALLFATTQPPPTWSAGWCDAMAPAYFAAFGAASLGSMGLLAVRSKGWSWRLAILAAAAMLAFCALVVVQPACAAGPFARLDPIVQSYWYESIGEGRPLWDAKPAVWIPVAVQLALGAAGYVMAIRQTASRDWLSLAVLFVAAALLGLIVMRASAFAAALAVPGTIYLLSRWMPRAAAVRPPLRLAAMFAVFAALFPLTPMTVQGAVAPPAKADVASSASNLSCREPETYAKLSDLGAARILAPLDAGPAILYATPYSVLASNHHRANAAIADTLRIFMGSDAEASALIRRRGVSHVLTCGGIKEMASYANSAPNGFAARLTAGEAPSWLVEVPLGEKTPVRLWRVVP